MTAAGVSVQVLRWSPAAALRRVWARTTATRLLGGRAVILDVETTDLDGAICQIAIIDTAGQVLLNTLVNPGTPCSPAASAVHGLVDEDLVNAPSWAQVWPRAQQAIGGRRVLAYNAPFDHGRVLADCARAGVPAGAVADTRRWWCVMRARAAVDGGPWKRLGGEHEALDDVRMTLRVLSMLSWRCH